MIVNLMQAKTQLSRLVAAADTAPGPFVISAYVVAEADYSQVS
jgi:hypothetical protein